MSAHPGGHLEVEITVMSDPVPTVRLRVTFCPLSSRVQVILDLSLLII